MYIFVQHSEAYLIQPIIQQYAVDVSAVVLLFLRPCLCGLFWADRHTLRCPSLRRQLCPCEASLLHRAARHADADSGRGQALDFEDRILFAQEGLQHELRNIVDRLTERCPTFVRAVMGVTVNDRLYMIEAVNGFA